MLRPISSLRLNIWKRDTKLNYGIACLDYYFISHSNLYNFSVCYKALVCINASVVMNATTMLQYFQISYEPGNHGNRASLDELTDIHLMEFFKNILQNWSRSSFALVPVKYFNGIIIFPFRA